MKTSTSKSWSQKVFIVIAALVLGFSLTSIPKALADDDRFVVIGNTSYSVHHDGNGPYIKINGIKFYLDSNQNDRVVFVNRKAFAVLGREHRNDRDHHDHDRDRHHHRHHHDED